MKKIIPILLLFSFLGLQAQSKFSLMPGIFYNGTGFSENVEGFGAIVGLEYMKRKDHFFSIELRSKFGYYSFDDGTKWSEDSEGNIKPPKNPNEARLEYKLFSPQISLVPKFHWHIAESFSLFIENEFVAGLMSGKFEYKNNQKSKFTKPIFCYNIGLGAEYREKKWAVAGSIAYSTLNFRSEIRKNRPKGYDEHIPNQNAGLLVNVIFKVPL